MNRPGAHVACRIPKMILSHPTASLDALLARAWPVGSVAAAILLLKVAHKEIDGTLVAQRQCAPVSLPETV